METIDFKIPNIGIDSVIDFSKKNKPYIDFNFNTILDTNGDNCLLNNGVILNEPTKLNYGVGLKFNGVDQNVPITFKQTTFPFTYLETGVSGQFFNIKMWRNSSGSISWYDLDGNYNGSTILNEYKDDPIVVIVYDNNSVELYAKGKYITTIENVVTEYYINRIGQSTAGYTDGVSRNIILIDRKLTKTEIRYQYLHPHNFLYKDSGILKSKILTQDAINDVKMFLPMCDVDDHVRDLVEYTESDNLFDDTPSISDDDEVATFNGDDVNNISVEVTTAGTNTARPFINMWQTTDLSDGYYLLSFDYNVNSGTCELRGINLGVDDNGYNSITRTLSPNGSYTKVFNVTNATSKRSILYFNGTNEFSINILNYTLKKLDGVYPIKNYTYSCRSESKFLSKGLQPCFWKRDFLGVPYKNDGSFSMYGITDYNAKYSSLPLPINDSVLAKGFTLEMVHKYNYMPYNSDKRILNNTVDYTGLRIQPARYDQYYGIDRYQMRMYMHGKDGDGNDAKLAVGAYCYKYKYHHIVFEYDGINTLKIYLDNVLMYTRTITLVPSEVKFSEQLTYGYDFDLRLFKIHLVKKDINSLYEDVFKKGLLNG